MASADQDNDDELFQDVISQFPVLNAYTQAILGFQIPARVDRNTVASSLESALDTLKEKIPLLGCHVVRENGISRPLPWPRDVPRDALRVKHCDDEIAPMAQLLRAGAPIKMLDGDILAPWPALPQPSGLTATPQPVFALQANFVKGGLLLCLSTHHNMIDGVGVFGLINLLFRLLSGNEVPQSDLDAANLDRRRVVPLIPPGEPVKDHSHLRRPQGYAPIMPCSPFTWGCFRLPVSSLSRLVRSVTAGSSGPGAVAVSDNDVLCAFYWQRVSAVRIANGIPGSRSSKLSRALDSRSAVGVPAGYLGHMVYHAITRLPLSRVVSTPLPQLAQLLRRDLAQANNAFSVRSYATFIAREKPNCDGLLYAGPVDPAVDVGISAVENSVPQFTGNPWGPDLGPPLFLRRPTAAPLPGCLATTVAEGVNIPVAVCLPRDDLEGLKKDAAWRQYMKFTG
ncbi:trichothecene 3-O-acetyltransferase [Cladorrhinum samala]|uniref:Trichothecene 3-O-acetyltransferase n=1 Tax=Cladorrhinum samala TaxID=585594 RepID=A0AAV9HYF6_9PEZI|nr:trichothecene 3-O-acetyltransferase [Cladorrhinum samala]